MKGELDMEWRNRDWFWVTGIMIAVIIFILAFRLSDNLTFMSVFSFLASGVSIALAFVAMYTSFKQNSDNQTLTTQMSETLARMDEKMNSMGQRVSEFGSVEEVKKILEARLNIATESFEETLSEEDGNITKSEVMEIWNNEMTSFTKLFDTIAKQNDLNYEGKNGYNPNFSIRIPRNLVMQTIKSEYVNTEFTMREIHERVNNLHKTEIPLTLIRLILLDLYSSGFLIQLEPVRGEDGVLITPIRFKTKDKNKQKE